MQMLYRETLEVIKEFEHEASGVTDTLQQIQFDMRSKPERIAFTSTDEKKDGLEIVKERFVEVFDTDFIAKSLPELIDKFEIPIDSKLSLNDADWQNMVANLKARNYVFDPRLKIWKAQQSEIEFKRK